MTAPERPDNYKRQADGRLVAGPDVPQPYLARTAKGGIGPILILAWVLTVGAAFGLGFVAKSGTPPWQKQVVDMVGSGCLPVIRLASVGPTAEVAQLQGVGVLNDAKAQTFGGTALEQHFELHVVETAPPVRELNEGAAFVGVVTYESCLPGAE